MSRRASGFTGFGVGTTASAFGADGCACAGDGADFGFSAAAVAAAAAAAVGAGCSVGDGFDFAFTVVTVVVLLVTIFFTDACRLGVSTAVGRISWVLLGSDLVAGTTDGGLGCGDCSRGRDLRHHSLKNSTGSPVLAKRPSIRSSVTNLMEGKATVGSVEIL